MHAPSWHAEPASHAAPHPPQFSWSVFESTQPLEHWSGSAVGQVQLPVTQLAPLVQTRPQAPQLLGSVWKSTHPLEQKSGAVLQAHVPFSQIAPVGHVLAHAASIIGGGGAASTKASIDASASVELAESFPASNALAPTSEMEWSPPASAPTSLASATVPSLASLA